MMTTINGAMLAGGSLLAVLIVVKVTVLAALGLAAVWLARRNRAAARHALLAVTFGATLVLPIASVVAPPIHIAVPVAGVSQAAWPLVANRTVPIPSVTNAAEGAPVAPAAPQQSVTFSLSVLLLAGWIIGTVVFLVPLMTGLWQIRSLRRAGLPWLEGQSIVETLALDAGTHRRVEVLLHEALPGPITCGVLHPAIVLPRDAESWAREDLSRAVVHELEHVRRGDSATRCLARAACALYWFHPLAWIAWRKLVLEAERSCDDAVLRRSEATAYADQLVGLAERLPTTQRSPVLAMASRSDLSTRIGAVLDSRQNRGRVGTFSVALTCSAAAALVIAVSPLTLVGAPQAVTTRSDTLPGKVYVPEKPIQLTQAQVQHQPARTPQPGASAAASEDGGPRPQFDVASVKNNPSGPAGSRFLHKSGVIEGRNVVLKLLLNYAYGVEGFNISGGPAWIDSERFDVQARAPEGTPDSQMRLMMQALLADRFQVQLHRETKNSRVFVLTAAKGGMKLRPLREGSCTPQDPNISSAPPVKGPKPICGVSTQSVNGSNMVLEVTGLDATVWVLSLSSMLGRTVINETGLSGPLDLLHFEYNREYLSATSDSDAISIPTALNQQLGLELKTAERPIEVLVIDHIEKPSPN